MLVLMGYIEQRIRWNNNKNVSAIFDTPAGKGIDYLRSISIESVNGPLLIKSAYASRRSKIFSCNNRK